MGNNCTHVFLLMELIYVESVWAILHSSVLVQFEGHTRDEKRTIPPILQ